MRSPLFSQGVLDDFVLKHLLGQQLLQPRVLCLQFLQPFGVGHAHAAELAAPQVVRGLAETMLPAQLLQVVAYNELVLSASCGHRRSCASLKTQPGQC